MNKINAIIIILCMGMFSSCVKYITKQEAYPKMYEEKPLSIVILPPINMSTAADAKEYYSTTIAEPFAESGFYIYPIEVVADIFKYEGIYDSGNIENISPAKFKEYFGADAVCYIRILKWDTSYFVIGGSITVSFSFKVVSTKSGNTLWEYSGTKVLDTSGDDAGAGGLAGCLILMASTAIKTAAADYVPLAKKANYEVLTTIPYGKYHKKHDLDRNDKIVAEKQAKYHSGP